MWVSTKKKFCNDLMYFQFLSKNDSYVFNFTNKKQMYSNEVNKSSFASIYSGNLMIEVKDSNVVEFLQNIKDTNNINYEFYPEQNNIRVDMIITHTEGFHPFKLELELELKDSDYFYCHFTCPLLKLIQLLKKNQENLCDLLRKKDIEISEYILEGGNRTQIPENIKTETYEDFSNNPLHKDLCDESLNLYELYSSHLVEQSNNKNPENYKEVNNRDNIIEKADQTTILKKKYTDHKKLNLSSISMDDIITHSSKVKKKKMSLLKNL